jgi:hypothetical protein
LDALQRELYQKIMVSGERSIAMTTLDEKVVLRVVAVSPHAKFENLKETIETLRKFIQNGKGK